MTPVASCEPVRVILVYREEGRVSPSLTSLNAGRRSPVEETIRSTSSSESRSSKPRPSQARR